jgi:tetratricopeptide (TPR) repeat protein
MAKYKRDPGLGRIILIILVIGAAGLTVLKINDWFQGRLIQSVEASAEDTLSKARALVDEGQLAEARELVDPIIARVERADITPKALVLLADIEQKRGNVNAALDFYAQARNDYPDNPDLPELSLAHARLLEEENRIEESLKIYQTVIDTAPPSYHAHAIAAQARDNERKGQINKAFELYRKSMDTAEFKSDIWLEAASRYGDINTDVIFSIESTPDSKVYRIKSGDSLTTIGSKLNTTQGLLMQANGISNPNRLRLNQALKYTPKDFEIVIERSTCLIYLLDKNGLFTVYRTGLGKKGHDTTLGKYKIGNKEKNPTWHKPGFGPIPPDDPENELGSRWMPLVPEADGLPTDLGIHGTIAPDSIGLYASKGCPRMHNEEVEELYDLIVRSTPVTIVEVYNPDRKI